jgi:chemotaxis protein methyltransferase CheR
MILAKLNALSDAHLLATDIDDGAIAKAKVGIYSDRSIRDVPQAYLDKYYKKENLTYSITDDLKRGIRFQKQNLLTDTFDTQFDLIICRNVMIYFTEEAKHLLYHKFANALKPGGILFVGSTEQIFSPGQYKLDPAETFFYRKKE